MDKAIGRLGLAGALGALMAGALGALVAGGPARAAEGFALELFEPRPGLGRALLGIGTSDGLGPWELSVGLMAHYEDDPMTLVAADDRGEVLARLVDERVTAELLAAIGFIDQFSLGVALPLVLAQSGEDLGAIDRAGETVSGVALGDLRLVPTFTLLGGDEGIGVWLGAVVAVPVGDDQELAGDGAVRVRPFAGVDWASEGWRVAAEVGYELRDERRAATYVSDDMVRWGVGARMPALRERLDVLFAIAGTVQTAEGISPEDPEAALDDAPNVSVEAQLGLELRLGELVLSGGGGASLVHAVGSPDVRAWLGIGWTSPSGPPTDDDGDGLIEGDQCPDEAEDLDGFEDDDGCPDRDNDGDGIPDARDACPDAAEDKDGDADEDGCPDLDADGDGVLEGDRCPNEPEDKDGFEDDDGCPDPDNDRDGIADVDDRCPDAAEDKDGFQDEDGCPDPDNDGDGVADGADKCPDRPEVKNGFEDDDGCPDTTDKDLRVTADAIEIRGRIDFPRDSDRIRGDSLPLLERIARLLNEHTYLTKVRVEGHTDSEGLDEVNLDLSRRRAAAVVRFLVERGVAEGRLTSEGYGEARPIAKNDTPAGRLKNRRVELRILEVNGVAVPESAPAPP